MPEQEPGGPGRPNQSDSRAHIGNFNDQARTLATNVSAEFSARHREVRIDGKVRHLQLAAPFRVAMRIAPFSFHLACSESEFVELGIPNSTSSKS